MFLSIMNWFVLMYVCSLLFDRSCWYGVGYLYRLSGRFDGNCVSSWCRWLSNVVLFLCCGLSWLVMSMMFCVFDLVVVYSLVICVLRLLLMCLDVMIGICLFICLIMKCVSVVCLVRFRNCILFDCVIVNNVFELCVRYYLMSCLSLV